MSNNPTSEKLTFNELIDKHKIEIPIIQRDYAQGRNGKEDIRINFLNALLEAVDGKPLELDFVYGSIKDNVLQPLDGQQRLTTLFLLYWYIAIKENKLDSEIKELLSKFTYETRTSSREFCNDLVNKGIVWNEKRKISELIIDSSWFFLSWENDPTIKSMLTMLDAIQHSFQSKSEIWDKLNNISFHYIELQNFGLSDDLYIKMNARGKPLTSFENFKAKFEQQIKQNDWEKNLEQTETFSHKIDTVWTDLFWNYRDKTENIFDEQLLNFFRTMAVNNYALSGDIKENSFRYNIDLLRNNHTDITFNQYLKLECLDENYFKTLKAVLNKISDKNGLKEFLTDIDYVNEKEIFNGAIKNNLTYPDLVILYALYNYLASEENIDSENLASWMRIVRNLVEGSRPYLFNNVNEFANSLRSINELLPYRNSIVKHFAETSDNSISGFIGEQINEEKLKAKLIMQSNEWKRAIIDIENHKYFNGQIGFLLHWCKINDEQNLDKFNEYVEKSKTIFGSDGLKQFDNHLFERALLATGNYLLTQGRNHSFLINRERDISWKRLLRDNNDKREILKLLFDKISASSLINDLQKVIDDYNDTTNWKYHFIKKPEIISVCGTQKLIRRSDDNMSDILLLGSSTTSGYHKEYYSYSLFLDLKNKYQQIDITYCDQRSVDYWKYFEYNNNQIAFNCDTNEYVWAQNNDWNSKKEFKDKEDLILEVFTEHININ
ncbi:DUF262 domain-containing protein [Elizabethkingia anophelis]|uniref:DUF262 domain-containing protein n=1 Tax=Elizabethkingia anophelis TaxID=1117645 RepID=UPI0037870190